jgi:ElaB/YqjD/DUF883 family membrane-anchored ribosome-binding protein
MASNTSTSGTQKQIDRVGDGAHSAIDRATETAAQYAERIGEKAEEWLEMKDTWVEGTREYVREHPIAALGIAAAAGYLLSILMRSRD